ncbi:putative membrane protein [Enterococcus faecalis D32]|nr:putative membrane protein [Enterococcus faecalis D32]ELA01794.1 hypothetical protein OG1X_2394 [Enterococcus faecalis OG1X]ELA06338.1 hypothetical protein EFM7_0359 [Enterococcus faecalis M7]
MREPQTEQARAAFFVAMFFDLLYSQIYFLTVPLFEKVVKV